MRKKAQKFAIILQQFLHYSKDPRVQFRHRHGGEPHLPIQFPMVRRDNARAPLHITGFTFELILAPFRCPIQAVGIGFASSRVSQRAGQRRGAFEIVKGQQNFCRDGQ